MIRMAAAAGTTDIVATPHANNRYRYDEAIVDAKIEELRSALPADEGETLESL